MHSIIKWSLISNQFFIIYRACLYLNCSPENPNLNNADLYAIISLIKTLRRGYYMNSSIKNISKKIEARHIILLFFIFNLFFLTNFPFVHSDEAWLSGLSRQIMQTKNPASTEAFFDLLPRQPHAIKILFHLLQIIFIQFFDYKIFTFRLISLLTGSLSLFIFYKISFFITKSKKLSLEL